MEWEGGRQRLIPGDCIVLCPGVWHRPRSTPAGRRTGLSYAVGWSTPSCRDLSRGTRWCISPPTVPSGIASRTSMPFCRQRSRVSREIAAGYARALFAEVRAAAGPGEPDPAGRFLHGGAGGAILNSTVDSRQWRAFIRRNTMLKCVIRGPRPSCLEAASASRRSPCGSASIPPPTSRWSSRSAPVGPLRSGCDKAIRRRIVTLGGKGKSEVFRETFVNSH